MLFRKEKVAYARSDQALEHLPPDKELRMLAYVHNARGAPAMLSLLELLATTPAVDSRIDDATQVNWAVDVFTSVTGLSIRQVEVADRGATVIEHEEDPPPHEERPRRSSADAVPQGAALRQQDDLPSRRPLPAQPRLAPCTVGIFTDRPRGIFVRLGKKNK
uniref:Uncharacterized protein n=1 Tax=Oryza brachyantha TaxID=4533 RepID=J3LNT6_ORYBR